MVLCLLVSSRFQVLFHSPPGVLFTFPSVVFSLTGWSPCLPSGFLVSRRTPDSAQPPPDFAYGIVTLFDLPFKTVRLSFSVPSLRSLPRRYFYPRFGLLRFRSPLLSESFLLSFPPGTKMFQFPGRCFSSPGSPRIPMCSEYGNATLLALSSLIRISADLKMFAPPRSFSQLATSFFGAIYQGILREPFVA